MRKQRHRAVKNRAMPENYATVRKCLGIACGAGRSEICYRLPPPPPECIEPPNDRPPPKDCPPKERLPNDGRAPTDPWNDLIAPGLERNDGEENRGDGFKCIGARGVTDRCGTNERRSPRLRCGVNRG